MTRVRERTDRPGLPASQDVGRRPELKSYFIGGGASLALTLIAFGLVEFSLVTGLTSLIVLGILAVVQIVVQFRYFLHIDLKKSHRDDLQLILFTALIISIMIGGTIWILFNQHMRM